MIEESYVTFETAKLAKKKDFDLPTKYYYDFIGSVGTTSGQEVFNRSSMAIYSRPTQEMLRVWLEQRYGLYIQINLNLLPTPKYTYNIYRYGSIKDWEDITDNTKWFLRDNRPDALESALIEALNLIP